MNEFENNYQPQAEPQAAPQPEYQAPQYQQAPPQYQAPQPQFTQPQAGRLPSRSKDRVTAGILALLLGTIGIHKFYLGYTSSGIIMLLVSLLTFGIGAPIMAIIALVEGIMYLTKSEEDFDATYVVGTKAWF